MRNDEYSRHKQLSVGIEIYSTSIVLPDPAVEFPLAINHEMDGIRIGGSDLEQVCDSAL